jgi:hypothetical protein
MSIYILELNNSGVSETFNSETISEEIRTTYAQSSTIENDFNNIDICGTINDIGQRFYIGKADILNQRITQHYEGTGSQITKKYGVKKMIFNRENCNFIHEVLYTLKYQLKFGINRVFGGPFCKEKYTLLFTEVHKELLYLFRNGYEIKTFGESLQIMLETQSKVPPVSDTIFRSLMSFDGFNQFINQIYVSCKDLCYLCNSKGHYSNDCIVPCTVTDYENKTKVIFIFRNKIKTDEIKLKFKIIRPGIEVKKETNLAARVQTTDEPPRKKLKV